MEKRVLNALILASSFLSSLLVIEAIVFDYSNAFVLSLLAASLFWGIYLFSRRSTNCDWPLWTYLSVAGLMVLLDWFFVGGHAGLALLVLVAIAGATPLITKMSQLKNAALLLLLFYGALYGLTAIYWHVIPNPASQRNDLLVQLIEVGILFLSLFSVAYLAISCYRREKNLVSSLNQELSRKNESLEESNQQLQRAYHEIKTLRGLLPTCAYCKKIRPEYIHPTEARHWVPIEEYIEQHTDAVFSHGICPECLKAHYGAEMHDKVFDQPP